MIILVTYVANHVTYLEFPRLIFIERKKSRTLFSQLILEPS